MIRGGRIFQYMKYLICGLLSYSHHSKPYIMDIYVMCQVLWNILLLGYLHGKHSEPGELEFLFAWPLLPGRVYKWNWNVTIIMLVTTLSRITLVTLVTLVT